MRVTYLCRVCTSANVSRDAWVEWDLRRQRWRIAQSFDTAWCHRCNAATTLVERVIDTGSGPGPMTQ